MDYTSWTATTQHNPPNPKPSIDPYASIYTSHYPSYYSHHSTQNPNPNPNPNLIPQNPLKSHETYIHGLDTGLRPPGVDSYAALSSYPHAHNSGYEAQVQAGVTYAHYTVDAGSLAVPSAYYEDPNAQNWAAKEAVQQFGAYYEDPNAQNWAAKEAVQQFGANPVGYGAGVTIPPNGIEQLVTAIPNSTLLTNPAVMGRGNGTWKRVPKKTKIIQSVYCEVCKIDCNSKDVLDQHKLGKRHKKNLEKLLETIAPVPSVSAVSCNPAIGPQENPKKVKAVSGQKTRKKAADTEDLETKKRKIVKGGAAADAVRTCTVCNVVCNSEKVFYFHLAGQKHAGMVKRLTTGTGVAAST